MKLAGLAVGLIAALGSIACRAAPLNDPTTGDLERLRQSNINVLVIEYIDPATREITQRETVTSADKGISIGGTQFRFGGSTVINSWGLTPCQHNKRFRDAGYDGPCNEFIREGVNALLRSGPVILCRAFTNQQSRPIKDASCFVLVDYSSVHGATQLEEFLVSGGYASLALGSDGKPLRPDLADDERIAKGFGRGLWSFEHDRPPEPTK